MFTHRKKGLSVALTAVMALSALVSPLLTTARATDPIRRNGQLPIRPIGLEVTF